jgi:hypothetical protein
MSLKAAKTPVPFHRSSSPGSLALRRMSPKNLDKSCGAGADLEFGCVGTLFIINFHLGYPGSRFFRFCQTN